jgi:hypothetical protein
MSSFLAVFLPYFAGLKKKSWKVRLASNEKLQCGKSIIEYIEK